MKRLLTTAVLSITAAAVTLIGPTPALADELGKVGDAAVAANGVYRYKNQAGPGLCMYDDSAGFVNTTCVWNNNLKWNRHDWQDGTSQLKNVATGRCIDDSSAGFRTWTCWAGTDPRSKNQSWFIHRWKDGTVQLKNQATGRCIEDTVAGGFRTWACWAGTDPRSKNQSWYEQPSA